MTAVTRRVAEHRQRLRAQGMRPVQVWVPDTRTPQFAAEARRQSRLAARADDEADAMAFIEAASAAVWDEG